MSFFRNDLDLNWEWSANRNIKSKVTLRVVEIKAEKRLFKSPSFANDLPEPMIFRGEVLSGNLEGKVVKFVLPKVELGDVSLGTKMALGMVDDETVVCIAKLPLNIEDAEISVWLEQWECK